MKPPRLLERLRHNFVRLLQTKGQAPSGAEVKRRYLDEWTRAVNAHGVFGLWRCAVAKNPNEIRDILLQGLEAATARWAPRTRGAPGIDPPVTPLAC